MGIIDRVFIKCPAKKAYAWFMALDKNYKKWHPDHIDCSFIPNRNVQKGTTIISREYLHQELHKLKMRITEIIQNEAIIYKNQFPMSIISPKGAFYFIERSDGIEFVAMIKFRLGRIMKRLFAKQYKLLEKHMNEEGINLKRILEK
jgi:hypothetical protein